MARKHCSTCGLAGTVGLMMGNQSENISVHRCQQTPTRELNCVRVCVLCTSPCSAHDPRRRLSHSMSHSAHDDDSYFADRVPLTRGYPSPPTSLRGSRDSDDSLRALELSEGPIEAPRRPRAHSVSGFNFQSDLIPLSASVSDSDPTVGVEQGEKNIGLIKGASNL